MERSTLIPVSKKKFARHGWIGLALVGIFWYLNWTLSGPRTQWGFFPLWLGYCLVVDALVYMRRGTSLLTRSWRKYLGLFVVSAPAWWLFEFLNSQVQNWHYHGGELFTPLQFFLLASLSFTTVIPAVFGTAELASTFGWIRRMGRWLVIPEDKRVVGGFFIAGWVMLALLWAWPKFFFPFLWISVYFILAPLNIWMGNRSLIRWLKVGDWRPVIALWTGVLITAFFWEMWNYFSYPKWLYTVPWVNCCHIFEMPVLGYGGYLPFSLELFALYHLAIGLFGEKQSDYVQVTGGD
jgi:hypothetical protein